MKELVELPIGAGQPSFHLFRGLPMLTGDMIKIDADDETANLLIVGPDGGYQAPMSPAKLTMLAMDSLSVAERINEIAGRRARALIARAAGRHSLGAEFRADAAKFERQGLDYSLAGDSEQAELMLLVARALSSAATALDAVEALNKAQGLQSL